MRPAICSHQNAGEAAIDDSKYTTAECNRRVIMYCCSSARTSDARLDACKAAETCAADAMPIAEAEEPARSEL